MFQMLGPALCPSVTPIFNTSSYGVYQFLVLTSHLTPLVSGLDFLFLPQEKRIAVSECLATQAVLVMAGEIHFSPAAPRVLSQKLHD